MKRNIQQTCIQIKPLRMFFDILNLISGNEPKYLVQPSNFNFKSKFSIFFLFLSLRIYDTGERHLAAPPSWAKINSVNSQ